jgi:hypothetical protein
MCTYIWCSCVGVEIGFIGEGDEGALMLDGEYEDRNDYPSDDT